MKKKVLVALLVLSSFSGLSSCGNAGGGNYKGDISFHTGYEGLVVSSVKANSSGKISRPEITNSEYVVKGYYSDPYFANEFDFDKPVGNIKDIYVKVYKGLGTEADPIQVESGLVLNSIAHSGLEVTDHLVLTKDINISSKYTEAYLATEFNGVLKGNGYTVTFESECETGLFNKVGEEGNIANLKVVGNIVGTKASTGAITNYNYGIIDSITTVGTEYHASNGCSNGVSLLTTFDENDSSVVVADFGRLGHLEDLTKGGAGGISGTNYGTIKNCVNKMRVSATIGAGSMAGINHGDIINCYNQGAIGASGNNAVNSTTIRDPNYSYSYIGGMAGANFGRIHQCANLNQVFVARLPWLYGENPAGQSDLSYRVRVGGIAGYNYSVYDEDSKTFDGGIITECINYGRVHGDMQVGGIAGYSNGYISDCFSAGYLGGRDAVGSIVGWQPGDRAGDYPGLVTNCIGMSRVVTGNENNVFDEEGNTYPTTKLKDASGGAGSNIHDYFKLARYATNSVYHNNSGMENPIDYETNVNTSINTTATMAVKVYNKVGYKDGVETGIWVMDSDTSLTTAMVGINGSWQVYCNIRLAWQSKTLTADVNGTKTIISGVAGIDYINRELAESSGKYTSSWNANLSGYIPNRGLPSVSHASDEKVIWVTTKNDPSTEWDGLLTESITVYPMVVKA